MYKESRFEMFQIIKQYKAFLKRTKEIKQFEVD